MSKMKRFSQQKLYKLLSEGGEISGKEKKT